VLLGLPEFEMFFPRTVEEACSLLSKYGEDAQLLAGGTDLFVKMKQRRLVSRILINIKRIPGVDEIRYDADEGLRIGALTTVQAIRDSEVISNKFRVLSQAAGVLGTPQIRNLGTLGGNLANASPSAEFAPPLLTLQASLRCVGPDTDRLVPMSDFFVGPGKSILGRGEWITEVHVPNPALQAQAIYLKHSLRTMDVSMAGAAAFVQFDGDVCREVRIALGAVAPTPIRAPMAEAALTGRKVHGDSSDRKLLEEVGRTASDESHPIDDLRGLASYRRKVVAMLVRQGLEQVIARARS
jgi:aerobic carbon-monoxide dehydrogenase medium subunit